MRSQRGFLYYDAGRDRYGIDWRESLSIIVGEALLKEILASRRYMRGRLLDVGCGKRPYALIYDPLVDVSVGTETTFTPHGIAEADAICYAEALPFSSESFDTILCTEVLEHTQQPFIAMQEFFRALKPGGYLLLSVPFIYPIHEAPHDYWRFTPHGLEAICRWAGFEIVSIRAKGGEMTTLVVILQHFVIWGLNWASRLFPGRPLRDAPIVRFLFFLLQKIWIRLARFPFLARDAQSYKMSVGYFIVATKGNILR
jgi:SAM-dependent methyltransferase